METNLLIGAALFAAGMAAAVGAYVFWRYFWFWRNPPRVIPAGEHFVSPADGTVVYVQRARPDEPIIVCKQGKAASINDIAREEMGVPKILVGIFMSPFSVHYNRAPFTATLSYTKQYPAEGKNVHMGSMHWRCLLRRLPIYARSPHITQNNRAVTRFQGLFRDQEISCYVVQIGGGSVHGIDVFRQVGQRVEMGEIFGMIRVGSQVDLIVPDLPGMDVKVAPGDRVVAGETVLIDGATG
ncbi:MAG: phosphatidylserine decarboxylase [Thermoguttaceae bacterium]